MEDRKMEEQEFHDRRDRDEQELTQEEFEKKYSNKKWYSVTSRSKDFIRRWIASNACNRTVLDYCCGRGGTAVQLALAGADVYAIDISPESVETTRKRLEAAGSHSGTHVSVMDAENMTFESNKFDVIVVFGVLHHLDIHRALPELRRTLKPGGRILCGEALGYNPIIAAYRRLTPSLRTSWEADHILTLREIRAARRYFRTIKVKYFHLFAILATPLRRTVLFKPALFALNLLDDIILSIPGLQLMAWQVVFELSDPVK